jgi:Fe2+ or Zn2+ uptake regulation protein
MIVARFEFKPEHAHHFIQDEGQNVIEIMFESIHAMIATTQQFEDYLTDCTAIVDGKVVSLRALSGKA